MQTFKIEHAYGCGSVGTLEIEADNETEARRIAREDFFLDSSDIFSVEELAKAA